MRYLTVAELADSTFREGFQNTETSQILMFNLDIKHKTLIIKTKDDPYKINKFRNCEIKITNWQDLTVSIHRSIANTTDFISPEADTLEEISIYDYELDNRLILQGLGVKTRGWLKYVFIKPELSIGYET